MVTDEEIRFPVGIDRLEALLAALATVPPGRLIIRAPGAVAELTCRIGDCTRKGDWLNYECEQFHAHINVSQIHAICFVEKGAQRSVQCFAADESVVFKYFFKDNVGAYDRLKQELA